MILSWYRVASARVLRCEAMITSVAGVMRVVRVLLVMLWGHSMRQLKCI